MKEPTALAPSAKNFQVVAPIGYGSESPYRLPSALFGYFVFLRNETVLLCLCITVHLKNMHAMPPLNTTQSGKLPDTTPPHFMQCFVATVRRRHPPKRFRNHVYHFLIGKISIKALQPLPSRFRCCRRFLVWMLARSRRGLRRSHSSGGPRCRIHATSGQLRSHSQTAPTTSRPMSDFWPNWTSSSLSLFVRTDPTALCAPCFRMCWSVKKTAISSAHREVTTSTVP